MPPVNDPEAAAATTPGSNPVNRGLADSYLEQKRLRLAQLQAKKQLLEQKSREAAQIRAWDWMLDPVSWVLDVVRFPAPPGRHRGNDSRRQGLAPYQAGSLRDIASNGRLLVYGPHGLGKSTTMALAVWWFATTRELAQIDWKIITTASSWKQLNDFLWPEIHKWAKFVNWERLGLREPELGRDLLGLGLKWEWGAASAAASTDPAKMEGAHATHLMYVLDEAKAIQPGTWDAIEGAFSTEDDGPPEEDGAPEAASEVPNEDATKNKATDDEDNKYAAVRNIIAVAMSTPGPATGRFYSIGSGKPGFEDWKVRQVRQAEVIEAGRMSRKWAEQREKQWGRGSSVFQMRVLGEFFLDDPDALVPLGWVEAAQQRWEDWKAQGRPELDGARWLGVDVAGGGADRTVMARLTGVHITRLEYPSDTDLMRIASKVARIGQFRPVVDTLGIGQGVTDRLRQMHDAGEARLRPVSFVGSASTAMLNRTREYAFVNQRSAAWWMVREALDPQNETGAMLPPDPELVADLTAPTWSIADSGRPPKIRVEPKDRVKEKLGRSPDFGDAVAMAFWAAAARKRSEVAKPKGGQQVGGVSDMGPLGQRRAQGSAAAKGRARRGLGASQLSPLGRGKTAGRTKGGL